MMMTKKLNALCVALALMALPGLSLAHPEHDDEPPKAEVKAELVRTKTGATVLLTKEGGPVSTAGASGKLTLLDDVKKTDLALKPARRNAMTVTSRKAISKGSRAHITINFADQTTLSQELVAK